MEELQRDKKARARTWEEHASAYEQKSAILNNELESINNEFNELERKKAKLAQEHGDETVHESDLIQINVGGRVITVRRGTLTYQKGTMLEAIFSGRWDKEIQRDGFGNVFLDVNPECFQIVVNYLSELKHMPEEISHQLHIDRELQPMLNH
eukprot:12798526-Ditylum_brightwellii.AAC.1